MFLIFKETRKLYIIGVILGIIGMLVFYALIDILFINYPHEMLPLVSLLLYIFILAIVCQLIAKKKFSKLVNMIYIDCDPEGFIEIYKTYLHKRIGNKQIKLAVLIMLSSAYLHAGRYLEAEQVLSEANALLHLRIHPSYRFLYLNTVFLLSLEKEDFMKAQELLGQMEEVINKYKSSRSLLSPRPSVEEMIASHQRLKVFLQKAKGEDVGYQEFLVHAIESTITSPFLQVSLKYRLGNAYLEHNEIQKAKEVLEYVVVHGGSTVYRQRAKEHLVRLGYLIPESDPVPLSSRLLFSKKQRVAIYGYLISCCLLIVGSIFYSLLFVGMNYGWGFNGFATLEGARRQERLIFLPSMESALDHVANTNRTNEEMIVPATLGEVFFVDEHESNITVFHKPDEELYLTFFMKGFQGGETFYAFIQSYNWAWNINLNEDAPIPDMTVESFIRFQTIPFTHTSRGAPLTRIIGRFPLYGYANHEKIHSLTINGHLTDVVVPTGVNESGESVYFFYFADIHMVHEENVVLEDFVVAIGGELIDFSITDGESSSFNPVDYAFTFVVLGIIALMIWRSRRRAKARQSLKEE